MNKEFETKITVFIIYGKQHISHIKSLLMPALLNQLGVNLIHLYLLNYNENKALMVDEIIDDKLIITDLSANRSNSRLGFGEGMNYMFQYVNPKKYFVILNPDTIPDRSFLVSLLNLYDNNIGIIESKQWPAEHPKEYDSLTLETPWASGAAALIDSENFIEIRGFDPIYFLYCEDVDLSWKTWLNNKKVLYCPNSQVMHFTGLLNYKTNKLYYEHFYSARNFIVIAKKFFGLQGEKRAIKLLNNSNYSNDFKQTILKNYREIKYKIYPKYTHLSHKMIKLTGFNSYHYNITDL